MEECVAFLTLGGSRLLLSKNWDTNRPYRKYSVRAQQTWNEVHAGLANYQIWE